MTHRDDSNTSGIGNDPAAVAKALGSAGAVDIGLQGFSIPLDALALVDRFNARLRSTGGRPTDPDWTLTRRIPFKSETWRALQQTADSLSLSTGHKVSASQIGAELIEQGLSQLSGLDKLEEVAHRAYGSRPTQKRDE